MKHRDSLNSLNDNYMVFTTSSPLTPARIGMCSLSSSSSNYHDQLWRTTKAPKFYSIASKYQFKSLNKGKEAKVNDDDDKEESTSDDSTSYESMNIPDQLSCMRYKIITSVENGIPFQSILILPPPSTGGNSKEKLPMIISPHGGN